MDAADVNGGNAEVVPNLEKVGNPKANEESTEIGEDATDVSKEEDAEVNGDMKITPKKGTFGKRKMRKSKANSTSIIESGSKPKTRGRKRKLSERENVSSEESTEFNGFDVQGAGNEEPGSHVLKKLIAEAESADVPRSKRPKRSISSKNTSKLSEKTNETKNLMEKDNNTDSEDNNMLIDDGVEQTDEQRIKKEMEEKSETDSIGGQHSLESENEPQKAEESSAKSANSSTNSSPSAISQKSKASRVSRGASPGSAIKQKISVDLSNPAYKEPFKYGWKRELVFRAGAENNLKRMADVYYYTPKGKKVRSFREVAEFLNTKELTIDNFTFFKEAIGIDDPEKEIIRDAKRIKAKFKRSRIQRASNETAAQQDPLAIEYETLITSSQGGIEESEMEFNETFDAIRLCASHMSEAQLGSDVSQENEEQQSDVSDVMEEESTPSTSKQFALSHMNYMIQPGTTHLSSLICGSQEFTMQIDNTDIQEESLNVKRLKQLIAHDKELAKLRCSYETEVGEIKKKYEEELNDMKKKHLEEIHWLEMRFAEARLKQAELQLQTMDSGPAAPSPARKGPAKKAALAKKVIEETPPKAVGKSPKVAASSLKVKLPTKKATPKAEVKPPVEESEMLPPQWSSPPARRTQPTPEKTPPAKTKRALKAKVQEPCSIRCTSSMGLIPSLQCRVCLCLYHPECVDGAEFTGGNEYVCKNCQQENEDSYQQQQRQQISQPLTPPPLIPISMLGAQNAKSKHPLNSTPPKLQRIPKSENPELQIRNTSKSSRSIMNKKSPVVEKNEGSWFTHSRNELLHSCDGILPKPAQNIALMAGKKYIVVPKNNSMAVQPAVTAKQDKIGDKPPILKESLPTEVSNSTENSFSSPTKGLTTKLMKSEQDKSNFDIGYFARNLSDIMNSVSNESCTDVDLVNRDDHSQSQSESSNDNLSNDVSKNSTLRTDLVELNPSNLMCTHKETTMIVDVDNHSNTKTTPITQMSKSDNSEYLELGDKGLESSQKNVNSKGPEFSRTQNKKRQLQVESEQRQHFMVSVCAGYHALSRVFQYLKVQELLRAARVCKMWRDLAAHPALWKTVRMKNSQVTDWDGLAESLKRHGTQHLDLRKMLVAGESDDIWKKFVNVIPRVTSLVRLELCRCPVSVVEDVIKSCPQLEVLSAMTIKCDSLNLGSVGNLKHCVELKLKAISGMSLSGDLTPLKELTQLTHLSLTSVKELGKKKIDVIESLTNLETLELGECSDFPDKFGTVVLQKLKKLERLRLEKGQGSCCTFDILEGVSKLEILNQLELVNFDVKNGFDKYLANCKNIKRLLIIPTYISQSATSNNMVLGGVTELSNNLTHFVWGVTLELLRVTELFVDQCNQMSKQVTGDSIPVLKPVPCLKLIEDIEDENSEAPKGDDRQQPNLTNPQVDILPLPQLQKLLLTALPKTRVKILKIPFHATWRQSISDSTTQ